ncbi:MAG: SDR family oxidoreductase [Sphaerochaeta sp.]|jgi:pteridine reductase|nr:SDR family oxidoreductase [Sphaerochaeta sp.]PKL29175.1 MAG: short-chain dehydrogenase [Spirochaetae bacterium HGW-Spirochaetae-2]
MKLPESVVVVTGASDRLGRMVALALAARGAKVVVHCYTQTGSADKTVALIQERGGTAFRQAADLTGMEGIEALAAAAVQHFGHWDGLVNCASVFRAIGIVDVGEADWQLDQDLHQRAPFFLSKALYRFRKTVASESPACVVNITDTGVRRPTGSRPSYYCAKSALEGQSRILGVSLAPLVRVNAVAPGAVLPAVQADEAYFTELEKRLPLGKLASPEDVVDAVVFLFENDSITGQTIVVDGGEHLL